MSGMSLKLYILSVNTK